jgi:hypothetical protein
MSYMNPSLYKRMEDRRRAEMRQVADDWRLLRQGQERHGWLSQKGCWLLCQLGRLLVKAGQQLQAFGTARPVLRAGD